MMTCKGVAFFLCLCFTLPHAWAQDFQWWANHVGWDGSRPYQHYLQLSPEGMGPNALPVPPMHRFLWDTTSCFQGQLTAFRHPGELTIASELALRWQASHWFRLGIRVIPLEFFETSREVKERRNIFWDAYEDRLAGGDFYIESAIRLPPAWLLGLHGEIRFGLKTASGTHLGAARYTDTPGYYVDMAFAGTIAPRHSWELMAGLYVYQTYEDLSRQNDAFLWGLGHRWDFGKSYLFHHLRGYAGYLRDGDVPVVYELEWGLRAGRAWHFLVVVGHGLHHYPFTYSTLGARWHFDLHLRG
jgi:hypothetical protein